VAIGLDPRTGEYTVFINGQRTSSFPTCAPALA
jgi:hypothetical protein